MLVDLPIFTTCIRTAGVALLIRDRVRETRQPKTADRRKARRRTWPQRPRLHRVGDQHHRLARDVHELVSQPLTAIVVPHSCVLELGLGFASTPSENPASVRELLDRSLAQKRKPQPLLGFSVEAPGIEADSGQSEITMEHQSGTISTDADPANVSDSAPKCAIVRGVVTESSEAYELSNVVETALARALVLAAEAKRWDVVMQIAEELGRRRPEQTGKQGTTGRPTQHGRRCGADSE
jgi:hypothetical protein